MKRFFLILLVTITALLIVGCSDKPETTATEPTEEPATVLHTVPPTEQNAPLEWAPVDCEITLESSDYVYADKSGFLTFALIGNSDENCALRFTLDEAIAAALLGQSEDTAYYLTVNGRVLGGTVSLSEDRSELTLTGYSYPEICALATEIRGL